MKAPERQTLLRALQTRFEENMHRHADIAWADVQARLEARPAALNTLQSMESSGGEPDVIGHDEASGQFTFCDCSAESPAGRRSVCYDGAALDARKENKPEDSAVQMAAAMGIELLTEQQYRELQTLGDFDAKTSAPGSSHRLWKLLGAARIPRDWNHSSVLS